jgi:hypothetical protein
MKTKLLVTTGLIAGFAMGSWTPLGTVGSFENVQSLASTLANLSPRAGRPASTRLAIQEPGNLGHIRSLIAATGDEPAGNIPQNNEILIVAGFVDPEGDWAMRFADLKINKGVTRASLNGDRSLSGRTGRNEIAAPKEITRGDTGGGNIGQSAPQLSSLDEDSWYSQSSTMELDRLKATIEQIEEENDIILSGLTSTEETHPDYHMALCVKESNDGLIAFYSFLVKMGEEGANLSDTQHLEEALFEEQSQTADHTRNGRTTAVAYRHVLEGLPANGEAEEEIKELALEYYDSFLLSFDVEETLAAHLTTYPDLIKTAIETGEPPYSVSEWVRDFQELGRSRMELQAYRQSIAQRLAGPNV